MIKVGLTGGIGSGKTTVANLFKELGVPVYIADTEAKRLMHTSKAIKRKLLEEFGKKAYIKNKLNRAFLANIVFNDKKKLAAINKIVHPSVANSFKRWLNKHDCAYVIQENAILFENNSADKFDFIITVTAPIQDKIERVMKRDNITKEEVLVRMKNQISDKEKIRNSNFVIENRDLKQTKNEVAKIHKLILKTVSG
jgi:dephospho-CoA kinase